MNTPLPKLTLLFTLVLSLLSPAAPRAIVVAKEDAQPRIPTAYHRVVSKGITLHLVSFDDRQCQLQVIDQKNGPGSQWRDAATLGKSRNALAVINAGFFTPQGAPLGKLITQGETRGNDNPSPLGSGFFYANKKMSSIARRNEMDALIRRHQPSELLQSGPMLVYRAKTVTGLSAQRPRIRSFLATDGQHHWLIGYAQTCTLADLGSALIEKNIAAVSGIGIYHALNLDGGSSSDLWISPAVQHGNKSFRMLWNKPVRNFLLLTPR